MSTINYDLNRIKALAFDVDGVLSCEIMPFHTNGEAMRTGNVKDGYALQLALKQGFKIAIITGGNTVAVRKRFESLDIPDIFMDASRKVDQYNIFRDKYSLRDEEILYMGDDIPDIEILRTCGLPCCPKDAVPDVKQVVRYISHCNGGHGCVRDVIEQVLRAQEKWMMDGSFHW